MVDSKWTRQWPELFAGLSDAQVRGVVGAIDNNVLEGWNPQRDDIEFLVRSARGEFTEDEEVAEAVAMAQRSKPEHAIR